MNEPIKTEAPVTISIDLDAFANHILNDRGYRYGDEEGEPNYALDPILGEVVTRVTKIVSDRVVKDAVTRVSDRIDAELEAIVRDAFDGEFQPMTPYGSPDGPKTNLRERIVKQANEWFSAPRGDGYGARQTNGQKFIKDEVERVVLADCKAALESNRDAIVAKIKDIASTLLATEATKR